MRVWSPKYINNSYNSIPGTQTIQFKKWAKDLNRHFSKADTEIAHRHMKKFSTSLAIREMQIKTTVRCHLTLIRMAIITKSTNNKLWWECREKGTLVHCWWECRLVLPLWKTVWKFLKKLKIELLLPQWSHCCIHSLRILNHQFKRTYAPLCSYWHYLQ